MKVDADIKASGVCKVQAIPEISNENNGIKNNKRPLISAGRLYGFFKKVSTAFTICRQLLDLLIKTFFGLLHVLHFLAC